MNEAVAAIATRATLAHATSIEQFLVVHTHPINTKKFQVEDRTCSICLVPYGQMNGDLPAEEAVAIDFCGHIFGHACLAVYVRTLTESSHRCPMCRTKWMSKTAKTRETLRQLEKWHLELGRIIAENSSQREAWQDLIDHHISMGRRVTEHVKTLTKLERILVQQRKELEELSVRIATTKSQLSAK